MTTISVFNKSITHAKNNLKFVVAEPHELALDKILDRVSVYDRDELNKMDTDKALFDVFMLDLQTYLATTKFNVKPIQQASIVIRWLDNEFKLYAASIPHRGALKEVAL